MNISQRMMLAFTGLTVLVLMATLGLARWSFERGFLDYVNAQEQARLEEISLQLAANYSQTEQWQHIPGRRLERWLSGKPETLLMERRGRMDRPLPATPENTAQPPLSRPPPPYGRPPPPEHRPPPHKDRPPPEHRPPPHKDRPPPGRKPPPGPPTSLLDAKGEYIAGAPPQLQLERIIRVPVMVAENKVGELVSLPRRHFISPIETAFSRQQWLTSIFIGVVSLLLAIVVAWWLTRILLKPVQNMMRGVHKLSQGEYQARLTPRHQDELGRLAHDINHLAATLEENRASRKRWLADISHELRTPVTVLTGEIAAIQEGIRPFSAQQLESLAAEVERLRHLIDDLYQLSVSEMGGLRYELQPLDLSENVGRIQASFARKAQETGIDIRLSSHQQCCQIEADSQRIDQLLSNLLNNALAYTDAPGLIEISLACQGNDIVLEIQDSPPGVKTEDHQRLFEPLYRRDESRSRHSAGAGLGLAICQNIVQAHRGTITASTSALGGLLIHITFPAWRPAA